MKIFLFTTITFIVCAIGLSAQYKKADSATVTKAVPYTMSAKDSLLFQKAEKNAQSQQDILVEDINREIDFNSGRNTFREMNDVIDAEHQIK